MKPDLWYIYENMFRSRLFEEAITGAWNEGSISGEMHLSVGEEALAFFGEGAMNQGMLLEAMNLAVAWRLPVEGKRWHTMGRQKVPTVRFRWNPFPSERQLPAGKGPTSPWQA